MKKTMTALAAATTLLGMAAAPALAEASLSFSGEMRTRAWIQDVEDADTLSKMDHRLRMYGIFDVNDNVQVHFRTDLSEATWGATPGFGSGRIPDDGNMQVDRAFLQLTQGSMQFRSGLQYVGLSPSQVVNSQDEGFQLVIDNEAAPIKMFAVMDGDDIYDAEIESENWLFGAGVSPTFGGVSMEVFGAYLMATDDIMAQDRDIYLLGAAVSADAGMARIFGELNYFDGDANDTIDVMGLQGYVGADVKASDALTITPTFVYAQAADADEVQVQVLGNDFNGWDPVFDIGTKLDNEQIGLGRPFDWTGAGAGVVGGFVNVKYMVSEKLDLGGGLHYLTTEDDDVVDESTVGGVAGFSYALLPNTKLDVQAEYLSLDEADTDIIQGGVYLGVSF